VRMKRGVFTLLAGACLLATVSPGAGWAKKRVPPPPPAAPAVSPEVQAVQAIYASQSDGISTFYSFRHNNPFWLNSAGVPSAAVPQLLTILKRATLDGFADGPALATQLEGAIAAAQTGDAVKIAYAERLMSSAWTRYVQQLKAPASGVEYAVPYLAPRAVRADQVLFEAMRAPSLDEHLRAVSDVNPIHARLRDAIAQQLQATGAAPDRRMLSSLDRTRILPATGRFIMVDAASARLFVIEDGQIKDSMKVVVGMYEDAQTKKPTPLLHTPMIVSMISYATFNPYWHVPEHLVVKTVAPNVIKSGAAYLKQRGYQVINAYVENPVILNPTAVDWKAVAAGTTKVPVRQLPGGTNSMGALKFQFPNSTGIYLHDTPAREHFAKAERTISNGCIRLEDAKRLGRWLLGRDPVPPTKEPEQHVQLPQGVPVYVTYLTAQMDGDKLVFPKDVYAMDSTPAAPASQVASAVAPTPGTTSNVQAR